MANVMASLGFLPGVVTLLGDLVKCLLAMTLCCLLFRGTTGWIVTMYAGLGCTVGHDFPFWLRFRGGKGVATSSILFIIFSPLWGILANLGGLAVVLASGYLCLAGPVIPLLFMIFMFCTGGVEAGILSLLFTLLALYCHGYDMIGVVEGKTARTDVLGALRRKLGKQRRRDG